MEKSPEEMGEKGQSDAEDPWRWEVMSLLWPWSAVYGCWV